MVKTRELGDALHRRARVSARWGYPHDLSSVNTTGRVIGYSETPMVLIETDDGRQLWWAVELTVLEGEGVQP